MLKVSIALLCFHRRNFIGTNHVTNGIMAYDEAAESFVAIVELVG